MGISLLDVDRGLRSGSYEVLVHFWRETVVGGRGVPLRMTRRMAWRVVPHPWRCGPGH